MEKKLRWKDRIARLQAIKRYGKFSIMFYRTDLFLHSRRVEKIVEFLLPEILKVYPQFDGKLARLLARHHDDFETILEGGDISLQLKLKMSEAEQLVLKNKEFFAIQKIATIFPKKTCAYNYYSLLTIAVKKDSIEAQLVSFVDKLDGYCEAVHELLSGNSIFLEPVMNYLIHTFSKKEEKFPLIKKLFQTENLFFNFKEVIGLIDFNKNKKTEIFHYEIWKKISIKNFGKEVLYKQTEFYI